MEGQWRGEEGMMLFFLSRGLQLPTQPANQHHSRRSWPCDEARAGRPPQISAGRISIWAMSSVFRDNSAA